MSRLTWIVVASVLASCAAPTSSSRLDNHAATDAHDAEAKALAAQRAYAATRVVDYTLPDDPERYRREFDDAVQLFVEACRLGHARSCVSASYIQRDLAGPMTDEIATLLLKHCKQGDRQSCNAIPSNQYLALGDAPGWMGRSQACMKKGRCDLVLLREECDRGYFASCKALRETEPAGPLEAKIQTIMLEACRLGHGPYCLGPAEMARQCQMHGGMFCVPRPDERLVHCRTWGDEYCFAIALEEVDRGHVVVARDLFELACKHQTTCKLLIPYYEDGSIPEPVPGRAEALRRSEELRQALARRRATR
jgi:hypothetical protein